MADITLTTSSGAELGVRSADLYFPYIGNWTSHLVLADSPDTLPSGRVTLDYHGLSCKGYLLRIGTSEGQTSALVVGGAGGLWKVLDAKYYDNQPAMRLPLQEILSAAGESLADSSTPSVLSATLPSWPRRQDQAGHLLDTLADTAGALWRVLPEGAVFFGTDTPLLPIQNYIEDKDWQLLRTDPEWLLQEIAPLTRAGVVPGLRFGLGTVARVHYEDDGDRFVARIWYLGEGGADDPVVAGIRALAREEMRGTVWHSHFGGEVVQQRGDGTLDVQMDDRRLPPVTSRPLLVPIPGAALDVAPGSRCQVAFAGGDPQQPFVQLYETGQGTKPIGIDGDEVDLGLWSVTITSGAISAITIVPPGGGAPISLSAVPSALKGKLKGGGKLKHP